MCRIMFMFFVGAGLLLGWSGSSWAADDCKAILAKAIQAHGGEEKLAKIHAVQTKRDGGDGDIQVQGGGNVEPTITVETSFLFPDKYKRDMAIELQGQAFHMVTVYNKGKGSMQVPGQAGQDDKEIGEDQLNQIKEQIYRKRVTTRLVDLKDAAYTLSSLPEEKVANKPAVGFKVKTKGFRDLDLFFDKATGLLVKVRYEKEGEKGKKTTEETIIKEHQKVDGIAVPKKVGLNQDGKEVREVEYTETKLLPTMDEKEFDKSSSK